MFSKPTQKNQRNVALSRLDGVILLLTTAKDACGVPPAQVALGSACVLLTTIKVRFFLFLVREPRVHPFTFAQDTMGNKDDYIGLGISCAEVCKALDRGLKGTDSDEPTRTVVEAIDRLKA